MAIRAQLQMYDIRYAPNGLQRKPKPNSRSHTSTRPYLTFPEYEPESIQDFDVSNELGMLASGASFIVPPRFLASGC